jgi:uncharacterized protein
MDVRNAVAVVTGGSRGIGAATATSLGERGARVIRIARKIDGEGTFSVDLTDARQVDEVARKIGPVDVVVNCAGTGAFRFLDETSPDEIHAMIAAPYLAAAYTTRAFLPGMIERRRGHVVNITSAVAFAAIPGATAYAAGCFAIRGFSDALRMDVNGSGVGVTLVVAGTSTTPGYQHYPNVIERTPKIVKLVPLNTPEKIARALVNGIERERRIVIVPFALRAMLAANALMPRLVERLLITDPSRYRQ